MKIHDFERRVDVLRSLGFSVMVPKINEQVSVERLRLDGTVAWRAWVDDGADLVTRVISMWISDGSPGAVGSSFNGDECGVLEEVAKGLRTGRRVYGPLVLDEDKRDMELEALEEARDLAVYLAASIMKLRRARGER